MREGFFSDSGFTSAKVSSSWEHCRDTHHPSSWVLALFSYENLQFWGLYDLKASRKAKDRITAGLIPVLHVLIYFPKGSKMKNKGKSPHGGSFYHQNSSDTNISAFLCEREKLELNNFSLINSVAIIMRI